jgi:colanic acid biosynthesis glycosyl transferase WcaI
MRVIILNQFFYPDHSATSQLMTELAESLVERGVQVTALSGRGRYNGGEKLPPRESYRGVAIERAWATSFGKRTTAARLSDYLSFYLGSSWRLILLPRHDIVMALTTPPLIALVALLIGRLRGMRVVALLQDVYPDVAVALGAIDSRSSFTRALKRLNRFVLRRVDRTIVLGECMRDRVAPKAGAPPSNRIAVIHNWADGSEIKPLENGHNPFSAQHELAGLFVVLFSGNLGLVNDFATVLEAARLLADRLDILFLFVGEGSRACEIESFTERHGLRNIRTLPYQPRDNLRYSLAAGHASLVTLAEGLAGLSVPSKTYAALAAGRPILFVGDRGSSIASLVSENGCGAVVEPGDSDRLARIIVAWAASPELLAEMGRAARSLFISRFDRPRAVSAYMETFSQCMETAQRVSNP